MKTLKDIKQDLPDNDKETISEIIYNTLLDKGIDFSSYDFQVSVSYSDEKDNDYPWCSEFHSDQQS